MPENIQQSATAESVLTQEQEAILDSYIENLDDFFAASKEAEKVQVEIETLHLKRILNK
jgi:hypothetical protein